MRPMWASWGDGAGGRRGPTKADPAAAPAPIPDSAPATARVRQVLANPKPNAVSKEFGFKLAASPAVKIYVDHEDWYRVTQPQLAAAGFGANVNPKFLHLYAEGIEQPIKITGGERFGSQSAIEFYGTAIDTPYSGQRVYWLTEGRGPGLRIGHSGDAGSAGPQAQSFLQTVELKPRTTYFATLLREDIDDFFGPLVSSVAESETVSIANLAAGEGKLAVTLQGVTDSQAHTVTVVLNGATLGELNFANQNQGRAEFQIPSGVLTNGSNTITFVAQQGENDLSLVDTIDLSFPHSFTAESDMLKFTAGAGESVSIGGFIHPARRLIDVTDLLHAVDTVFSAGWDLVKLYFMIGLPSERDEDVRAIVRLSAEALHRGKKLNSRAEINVGVSTFCPNKSAFCSGGRGIFDSDCTSVRIAGTTARLVSPK